MENEIKPVMMSMRPNGVEKVLNGKKTVAIRRRMPKQDMPFKCYIYCGCGENHGTLLKNGNKYLSCTWNQAKNEDGDIMGGYVLCEFTCNKIDTIRRVGGSYEMRNDKEYTKQVLKKACINLRELHRSLGKNDVGYAWHISDLVVYDKPKRLERFRDCNGAELWRAPSSWFYVEEMER